MRRSPCFPVAGVLAAAVSAATPQVGPSLLVEPRYAASGIWDIQDTLVVAPFDMAPGDDAVALSLMWAHVMRNGGNGLVTRTVLSIPLDNWRGTTAIDVERDGDLDVIAVASGREPLLLLNDGSASFAVAPASPRFPGSPASAYRVAAADVDGDGFEDLLIGAVTNFQSQLWRNDGTGRFVDITATHLPVFNATVADIQPADLDGDGDVDFALAQGYGVGIREHNAILLNQGGGRFTYQPLVSTRQTHSWAAVADFTGDGLPDIVFGNPDATAEYWINMGGGQFFDGTPTVTNVFRAFEGAAGDVDGDGWPDLVTTSFQSGARMELYLNQRGHGFVHVPGGVAQFGVGFNASNIELRDMDGDGDLDAIARSPNPSAPERAFWVVPNTTRHVLTDATVQPGGTYRMTLWARTGDLVVPALATAHVETNLGPLGTLGLDPASLVALPAIAMTAWSQTLTIPVPPTPWLIGRRIWAQAVVVTPAQPLAPRLTNWLDTEIVR